MASAIKRDLVLANFRKREPREKKQRKADRRPGMSDAHLALVRRLPCSICGARPPCDPHHLKDTGGRERGMGLRSTDRWAVPMCRSDHDLVEAAGSRNERRWFLDRGIDAYDLAVALWQSTGDLDRMTAIVTAHRGAI